MVLQNTPPRYPERSSSLSAIDFPHGPPNSPSKTASPSTAMTLIPGEEIPAMSLVGNNGDEKRDEMINALQRSLSQYEIKEPMIEEFTFEPIDGRVIANDVQLLPAALEIKKIIGIMDKEYEKDEEIVPDQRIDLHSKDCAGLGEVVTDNNEIEDDTIDMQNTDLNDKNEASSEEETDTNSRNPSLVETPPSAIVRPATPMVPLVFGRKNKNANKSVIEPQSDIEQPITSSPRAETPKKKVDTPAEENSKENELDPAEVAPKKKTFVVGISGCSAAGKSLLATILSEIFEPVSAVGGNGEGGKVKPTITIAQDDFFHPKSLQPFVTFTSTLADAPFMEKSIHHDELGMYFISSSGTRPSSPPDTLLECPTGTRHAQRTDSFDSNKSDASRLLEGGHRPRYQVTGPMPDCDQALDFVGLVEAITSVKTTGQLTEYEKRFPCDEDMDQYSDLIANMKEKVAGWVKEQAALNAEARFGGAVIRGPIESDGKKVVNADTHGKGKATLRPQFVFVEGFLLLADASKSKFESESSNVSKRRTSSATLYNVASEKAKITKYLKQLDDLSAELTTKDNTDDSIEGERDVIEAQFWATNLKSKEYLQGLFDVKLFLNASKGEAKRRRFGRAVYRDAPEGGRMPGQMWKSEGFFEEVVWRAFEKAYEWLLLEAEGDGERAQKGGESLELGTKKNKKGINFEPVQDAGVEDVVEWAVDVMLAEMGRLESEARIAGGGCSTDD
ncbi:hypothetical protein BKA64DRAFT_711771 [Cadophora sp. MPI-SDFR-AT-0126]|nr:hypothetical protein BKA64DRAFT_711771 [Leotiomycetes sp. MPI-SDFR-AT-0126]